MSLFSPEGVAIVGASQDAAKIGTAVLFNLRDAGYTKGIFPINPKYPDLHGFKCYPSVGDIAEDVELVVIAVPQPVVMEVMRSIPAKASVKYVVIITAGYSETGEAGAEAEQELAAFAAEHNLRLVGPNCLGLIVPNTNLNVSFASNTPQKGNIAFLSQSGAFNTAMLDLAMEQNLGFSHFVSMGNKCDLNEIDFVEEWLTDDSVQVVGLYLEEFSRPQRLLELAQKSAKPFIVLHPGESKAAQSAIASHTGSLANSATTVAAALQKAGVIQVHSVEEMFNTLQLCSWMRRAPTSEVVVVTNAGGPGIILTDLLEATALHLQELSPEIQSKLREVLPAAASVRNPIDLLGDADAGRYKAVLDLLAVESSITTVIAVLTPQYMTQIPETAQMLVDMYATANMHLIPLFLGDHAVHAGLDLMWKSQLPAFQYLEEAARSLGHVVSYTNRKSYPRRPQIMIPEKRDVVAAYVKAEPGVLPHHVVQQLCFDTHIRLPKERFVRQEAELVHMAAEVDYPLVMKPTAEVLVHKTDVRAVYTNIKDEAALQEAYTEVQHKLRNSVGKALEFPVLLQQQLDTEVELFIGVQRDGPSDVYATQNGFGHVLVFGTGGIYTEVYRDIAQVLLPAHEDELRDVIERTKVYQIIGGARGKESLALDKLVAMLQGVQRLVFTYPEIVSLDINPVMITTKDCVAADVKIFVQK